ncbi:unnamed protein product [Penicillium bialowiezense]
MPPRRLAADATLPPFFRSSDVFHSSQTEAPLIENAFRHVNGSHNIRLPRRLAADVTLPPFFRSSDVFHDSQAETPPIGNGYEDVSQGENEYQQCTDRDVHQIRPPLRLAADVNPPSGALMPSTVHKQRLRVSKLAVMLLVKCLPQFTSRDSGYRNWL